MKIHVTILEDKYGYKIQPRDMTLFQIRDEILKTEANSKEDLMWLKLARFGDKKSPISKKSLRWDGNVEAISGIELDYDTGTMPFADAVKRMEEIKVQSLIYTTASSTDKKPKWRVLCPTSCEQPPEKRAGYVARIQGAFNGIFAEESFTLSQGYYYGYVKGNPSHQAVIVKGDYINTRSDLDASSIHRRTAAKTEDGVGSHPHEDWSDLLSNIREGKDFHHSTRNLAAKMAARHTPRDLIISIIQEEMKKSESPHDRRWLTRYNNISTLVASGIRVFTTVSIHDFVAYMPMHNYIYMPTREPWPASSVDARLPPQKKLDKKGRPVLHKGKQVWIPAHTWIDQNNPVEQMLWAPGLPSIIENKLMNEGGWIQKDGVRALNLYIPPDTSSGNPDDIGLWLDHVHKIYPKDANHIIKWLAHRVQRPEDKINHALVLGGAQGIGKDTILSPLKYAIGPWNFKDITPKDILGRFNEFIKGVILRISEARDLGEINRYQFYEHTKVYTASPPEVLRCDGKNLREHAVLNVCGVIITTNYKTNGIYLPADDRRHYVAWSTFEKEQFSKDYWIKIWKWYERNGCSNVTAYLSQLDISDFDAKAPPPKTEAFMAIVDASRSPEENEFSDILDAMKNPDVVTIDMLAAEANKPPTHSMDFYNFLTDRKNRRLIPHRMETAGYGPIRNSDNKEGLWIISGKRQVIYAKQSLTIKEQLAAARKLQQ